MNIIEIKVSLEDIEPAVTRNLEVPAGGCWRSSRLRRFPRRHGRPKTSGTQTLQKLVRRNFRSKPAKYRPFDTRSHQTRKTMETKKTTEIENLSDSSIGKFKQPINVGAEQRLRRWSF